ncbi:helix-turn-helix transcriptional regulator [bacterium]|nr:helix-turn-helix transcriptional regulator [bacterium]
MKRRGTKTSYPLPLARALRKFGGDIKDARRRRRISVAVMAERASISRVTLNKIEKGEPGVSFGSYAMVLFVLGLTDRLSDLLDVKHDELGLELAEENLPKRIRKPGTGVRKKKR